MGAAVDVTFKHIWPTDEAVGMVRELAQGIEKTLGELGLCLATIERPSRGKGKGRKYKVEITIATGHDAPDAGLTATAVSEHSRLRSALVSGFRTAHGRLRRELWTTGGAGTGAGGERNRTAGVKPRTDDRAEETA